MAVLEGFGQRAKAVLNEFCSEGELVLKAERFLNLLGYESDRKRIGQTGLIQDLLEDFMKPGMTISHDYTLVCNVGKLWFIFQAKDDEIKQSLQRSHIGVRKWSEENGNATSLSFFVAELALDNYNYATLAKMVHSVNRVSGEPCIILFKYANKLSIGAIDRRLKERDDSKDVLGRISLIKDVSLIEPSSAHIDKLEQLSLMGCQGWLRDNKLRHNFDGLLKSWLRVSDERIDLVKEFAVKRATDKYSYRHNSEDSMIRELDNSRKCLGLPSSHCEDDLAHWNQYH